VFFIILLQQASEQVLIALQFLNLGTDFWTHICSLEEETPRIKAAMFLNCHLGASIVCFAKFELL
jgi:hypothetical protein